VYQHDGNLLLDRETCSVFYKAHDATKLKRQYKRIDGRTSMIYVF